MTVSTRPRVSSSGSADSGNHRDHRFLIPAGVCVTAAVLGLLPLVHLRVFYFWDDSAAVFVPSWHHIGSELLAGRFPALSPGLWQGGNIAAEAQLSLWNPVMLANDVLVALMPDLAVSAALVKIEFLVLLALGVYLLCREYGARRGASAAVAVLLPFAGFTLYFDASAWAVSMISFAWVPHLWWSARRCADGRSNPLLPAFFGIMAMTCGSPYGALGVGAVLAAVLAERLLVRAWRSCPRLLLVGLAIAMTGVVVYFPLVLAGEVSFRTTDTAVNDGFMVTGLGDLVNLSSPTFLPHVRASQLDHLTVPYAFLGWFVLPLVPWLRWSALRGTLRERAALPVFCAAYVLITTGPSRLWLFRWPMRLIDYAYLPVCVTVALLLSAGLHRSAVRRRALGSAGLIGVQAVLAFSATPAQAVRHLAAAVLVGGLCAAAVAAARYRERLLPGVLVLGTVIVLFVQLTWYPVNAAFTPWRMPHDVAALRDRFSRYQGNTFTVADVRPGDPQAYPGGIWKDALAGSMYAVAGVHSLNSYTGIGFVEYSDALCLGPSGSSCADSYRRLWQVAPVAGVPLADLLRLETVVVRNGYLPGGTGVTVPPPGWRVASHDDQATVLRRIAEVPWPSGRVSWQAPGLTVAGDRQDGGPGEEIRYRGGGTLVVAGLAWPGTTAEVDGRAVPVRRGVAGLITVELPATDREAVLRLGFREPGFSYGVPLLVGGVLLALLHGLAVRLGRRRGGAG